MSMNQKYQRFMRNRPDCTEIVKIFVDNIKLGTSIDKLQALFEQYGEVARICIYRGFGFVYMMREKEALEAVEALQGCVLNGQHLSIRFSAWASHGELADSCGDVGVRRLVEKDERGEKDENEWVEKDE